MPGPLADPERLRQPCPCGSGRRYKRCCHLRDLGEAALAEAAGRGHGLIDRATEELLRVLRADGRHALACQEGCDACCHSFIRARPAEVARVVAWLRQPENEGPRVGFLARFGPWAEAAGEDPARLEELADRSTGRAEGPEWEAFQDASRAWTRRRLRCPFNVEGACSIHPVRPTVCRATLVADTAARCEPEATEPPALVRGPALERAMAASRAEMARIEQQWERPPARRSLAHAVAEALARR